MTLIKHFVMRPFNAPDNNSLICLSTFTSLMMSVMMSFMLWYTLRVIERYLEP